MKVNYVISNYLGDRRFAPKLKDDVLFYAKAYCKYFQDNKFDSISKVTFVLNRSNDKERDNKFIDYIKKVKLNVEHEIIVRDNKGFSYGAWQEVVGKNKDFDYHFLMEDDYIPTNNKIIDYFLAEMKSDSVVYVCCIYTEGHCAMSGGLLNTKIVNKETRINSDMILNSETKLSDSYVDGVHNQRIFLKNFEELGYKINDLKDKRWLFVNHIGHITQHGNLEGDVILKPLYADRGSYMLEGL